MRFGVGDERNKGAFTVGVTWDGNVSTFEQRIVLAKTAQPAPGWRTPCPAPRVEIKEGPVRVLVCGGRDYRDWETLCEELSLLHADHDITTIIHGGARGADDMAGQFARASIGIEEVVYPANWKDHGKSAGPIRNQLMLDEGKPDMVVAFPGGRGTADMVRRAREANILVTMIDN